MGDPTRKENWLGPVVSERAQRKYGGYVDGLRQGGARMLFGGEVLSTGDLARGYLRAADARRGGARASAVARRNVPADPDAASGEGSRRRHPLANDSDLGLTAGVYGSPAEVAAVPRAHRSRRHVLRIARRARRPARGRATSRSAAGKARATRARRSHPSITWRSICASNPRRWSNHEISSHPHAAARPEGRGHAQALRRRSSRRPIRATIRSSCRTARAPKCGTSMAIVSSTSWRGIAVCSTGHSHPQVVAGDQGRGGQIPAHLERLLARGSDRARREDERARARCASRR